MAIRTAAMYFILFILLYFFYWLIFSGVDHFDSIRASKPCAKAIILRLIGPDIES